jgi:flagellar hook assembly protein FlgD
MHVVLRIFNVLGQEIRTLVDQKQSANYYKVVWDGKDNDGLNVGSGLYLYSLSAGEFRETKRMLLLR